MKKILFSSMLIASFAVFVPVTFAATITPGYGGTITCEPWREGQPKDASGTCFSNADDTNKRLYELEQAVATLQQQNASLQAPQPAAAAPQAPSSNGVSAAQFNALADRVTVIERTFTALSQTLAQLSTFLATVTAHLK